MFPLTDIHDPTVLPGLHALTSLATSFNSHIQYNSNTTYPQIIGCSRRCQPQPGRH
jgi:hypothetical protein